MSRYYTHSSSSVGSRSRNENPTPPIIFPNSKESPNSSSVVGQHSSNFNIMSPQNQTQTHSADSLFNTCLTYVSKHLPYVESLQHFPQLVAEKLLSHSLSSLSHNTKCTLRALRLFVDAYGVDFMTSFKAFSDGICYGFVNGMVGPSSNQVSESSVNGMLYTVLYLVILYMGIYLFIFILFI